jgi:hypothetical protein
MQHIILLRGAEGISLAPKRVTADENYDDCMHEGEGRRDRINRMLRRRKRVL